MGKASFPGAFHLTLDKKSFILFTPLLQRGVRVKVRVGCSLRGLLEDQLGLDPEYMKERIKTVFLDGKPVDDWDTALVRDGAVLALSAAMPGLAGATLRRGGFFAGMRCQIPQPERISAFSPEEGLVVVKLFNLLIPELGPLFLERGIFLREDDAREFLKSFPDELWKECQGMEVNGEETDPVRFGTLNNWPPGSEFIFSVHFSGFPE